MSVKQHEGFCFDSFQDMLLFFDDFHGDQIQDEWRSAFVGAGTTVVVDQQTGGIVRLTTGAVNNDSSRIDWNNIRSLLVTKRASSEFRVKLNQITNEAIYLMIMFDFNNYATFRFDTTLLANWQIICVDGGVGAGLDSGVAGDTAYHIFRIECHTHGANHVHFYIDGTETANSPITTNIPDDAGDYLQPYLYIRTRENLAKSMDVDYCYLREER